MSDPRQRIVELLLAHQRVPLLDGTTNKRCLGCDSLNGEPDGANSPNHAAHLADGLVQAGLRFPDPAASPGSPEQDSRGDSTPGPHT